MKNWSHKHIDNIIRSLCTSEKSDLTFYNKFFSFRQLVILSGNENQVNNLVELNKGDVDCCQSWIFYEGLDEGLSQRVHVADNEGGEEDFVQGNGGWLQAVTDAGFSEFWNGIRSIIIY